MESIEASRRILLICAVLEFTYLILSLLAIPSMIIAMLAFPALFILPGAMLLLVLKRNWANALQGIVEGFFVSTVIAVMLTSVMIALGISLVPFNYALPAALLVLVLTIIRFTQKGEIKLDKIDILSLALVFAAFVVIISFTSAIPRIFTPDETSYIFSARMGISTGVVPPMGVLPSKGEMAAVLGGRYFWIYLLTSFLGSTGLPSYQAGAIGVGFLVMMALASSLFVKSKWLSIFVFVAVVISPLLFFFSSLTLNDLALSFYAVFAVLLFVKGFSKTAEGVSLNLENLSFSLISVIVLGLIKPNLLVFVSMLLILIYVMFKYKVYKQNRNYRLFFLIVFLPILVYELCLDLPYFVSVWIFRNIEFGNFFGRYLFTSPLEQFARWFAAPWWNPTASTMFGHNFSDYIAYFYRILSPESSSLLVSATILALPILILSRDKRKELDKTVLALIVLLSLFLFYFEAISSAGLGDASRFSLWMMPLWIPLTIMTLQSLLSSSSFKTFFLIIVTGLVLLWSGIWLSMQNGGVYVGYGLPSLVWTTGALLIQFMGMIVLTSLLSFREDLSKFGAAIGQKLSVLKTVNLTKIVLCLLVVLILSNNVYFSSQFVEKSSLYQDHGFMEVSEMLGNSVDNGSLVLANNYIYMRPYINDDIFEKGLLLPLPATEQEFLNLTQTAPNNTAVLISNDQAAAWYEYANNYTKSFASADVITPDTISIADLAKFNLTSDALHMSFDTANDTFVPDISASGNNGINKGAQPTSGYDGNALHFNGTGYVVIPDNEALDIQSTITISFLAFIEKAEPNQGYMILSKGYAPMNGSYDVFVWDSQIYFALSSTNYVAVPASEYLGEWHHFIFTYDGTKTTAFVDGVIVATKAAHELIRITPYNLEIGRDGERGGYYFVGLLDDLQISNEALDKTELVKTYSTHYALRTEDVYLPYGDSALFKIINKEPQIGASIVVKTSDISIDQNRTITIELQIESSKLANTTLLVATDRFTKVYITPVDVGLNNVQLKFDYTVDPSWSEAGGLYWLHLAQTRLIVIDDHTVVYNKWMAVQNPGLLNVFLLAMLAGILLAYVIISYLTKAVHA